MSDFVIEGGVLNKYTGAGGDVVIPDGVTSIGEKAFWGHCSSLTSVTIPDSVTSIGKKAFCLCFSLTSITIGNGVTSIGDSAFSGCSSLTSVTIPNSVISIESGAFWGCSSLTSVTIPSSVTGISAGAFYDCSNLKDVYISDLTSWCNVSFGNARSNPLYYAKKLYVNDELITHLVIPNSVTSIGEYAFYACSSLTGVTIPDSVTSIGEYAFCDCSSLTSVTIPDSVTSIGRCAFRGCTKLADENGFIIVREVLHGYCGGETAKIPHGIKYIGGEVLLHNRLKNIIIPASVTSIDDYAFSGCYHIEELILEGANVTLTPSVFYDGRMPKKIVVPAAYLQTTDKLWGSLPQYLPNEADALSIAYVWLFQQGKGWQNWLDDTIVDAEEVLLCLPTALSKTTITKKLVARVEAFIESNEPLLSIDALQEFCAMVAEISELEGTVASIKEFLT